MSSHAGEGRDDSLCGDRSAGDTVWIVGVAVAIGLVALLPFLRTTVSVDITAYLVPVGLLAVIVVVRGSTTGTFALSPACRSYLIILSILIFWLAVSSLWSRTGIDFVDDLFKLSSILVLVVLIAVTLSPRALERAQDAVVVVGVVVAFWVFGAYLREGTLRGYGVLGEGYLVLSQAIGIAAVLVGIRWMSGQTRVWNGLSAVVLLAGLSLSLARGALIVTVLILFCSGLYVAWRKRVDRGSLERWVRGQAGRVAIVFSLLLAVSAVVYGALQVERTRARLLRMISGRELQGERGTAWREAWKSVGDAPFFGHGLGSNGIMSGLGEELYPHNWGLQVWLDAGAIGLALSVFTLAIPVVIIMIRVFQKRAGPLARWLPLLGSYVFLLLEYSKSSDFYSARMLFIIGVMLASLPTSADDRVTAAPDTNSYSQVD